MSAEIVKPNKKYLTSKEVMEHFKIGRTTLWEWCKNRGLKKSKVGRCTYFRLQDIETIVEAGFQQAA